MDVSLLIRERLRELGLDQKDLAVAAQVTESYISQLLARKKAPPSPGRTALYGRIGRFLKLPKGELSKLADLQRHEELKKKVVHPPKPLFPESRALILHKCDPVNRSEIKSIFDKQPFGELERLVTQKFLDVAQQLAREQMPNARWLRLMAKLTKRSDQQLRDALREFLDADVFHVTSENCLPLLDPMIKAWHIDLRTFAIEIVLNRRLAPEGRKRLQYIAVEPEEPAVREPGLDRFLQDHTLSATITEEEIHFLARLKFNGRRPTPLYFYRELQNLRDPLHFSDPERNQG